MRAATQSSRRHMRGRARGKTGHLQPNASDVADAEGRLFCVFQTRFPHSSTLQLGGKARFASQNNHFVFPRGFRVLVYQSSGLPRDSHTRLQMVPYTAAIEVLSWRAPRTEDLLPPLAIRGASVRDFIIPLEKRVEVPSANPPARAGFCVPLTAGEVRSSHYQVG